MIRKARRLPIECEFVEYTGDNRDEVIEWLGDALMKNPVPDDPLLYIRYGENAENFCIAGVGDYIVKDTNLSGECMFTAMYKEEFENHYMEEIHADNSAKLTYWGYKGYRASLHFSSDDQLYYGQIEGIRDLVNFHTETIEDFENEFHKAVDDYLEFCKEIGKDPE